MHTEDGHIIHECINGDSASFGLLVDKYKASIFALAYSRLQNFQDAEDVTQEVFLKAYKSLRTLRQWDNFVVWLRSVTINLCKNKIREYSRKRDKFSLRDQNLETIENASLDSYREEQSSSWRNEALDSLNEALNSLPEEYRQVLTLHYLGGMKGEEISKFLSISHDTVRQRLSRARAMLKEEVLAMISTNYEQQKLSASFTFRIIEMVKKIRIQPTSGIKGLPYGLSIGAGIIFAILSFGQHIQVNLPDIAMGLPLPSDMKVLKVGEIPVDAVKVATITSIGSKGDGKGVALNPKGQENAFFMASQGDGKWAKKTDMPTARTCDACEVDGKIYVIGGTPDLEITRLSTVEEYDPKTDKWTTKTDMPTPRMYIPVATVNGKIYVIAGNGGQSTVDEYDPKTDTWTKKKDAPALVSGGTGSASVANGKIYVMGGENTTVNYEYDPVNDKWTKKADMPTGRWGLRMVTVDNKIYTIGGMPAPGVTTSVVEEYDPVLDKWTKKADLLISTAWYAANVINGKIYVLGGGTVWGVPIPTVQIYDPKTDKWAQLPDMPTARATMSSSVVDGKIYVMGGINLGWQTLPLLEEYTPEDWQPQIVSPQGKLSSKWGQIKQE